MRIFFYSTVFAPSVGGIESLVEMLCRQFVSLGHEVAVATETGSAGEEANCFPFAVVRQPGRRRMWELLKWCDVHVQANVSLKAAWVWLGAPRKTLYQHNSLYRRDDGTQRLLDWIKTLLARNVPGIANSNFTASHTGSDYVVLNAYDDVTFHGEFVDTVERNHDLLFLGRLVSQKGCDTLIEALKRLSGYGCRPSLTIIGDGPDRQALEEQVTGGALRDQVRFVGGMHGQALAAEVRRHRILVAPSRIEEPFGIVALEGLACGCVPVVSEQGGLTEAIGGHGFTFPNGDAAALADTLRDVLVDMDAARERLSGVESHLEECSARAVAQRYIDVFEQRLGRR